MFSFHVPFLRYSIFYILSHFINFESCDAIIVLAQEVEYSFEHIFCILFCHETWSRNKIWAMGNVMSNVFCFFGGLGSKYRPVLIYQPTTINQNPVMMSLCFIPLLKLCTETIKKELILSTKNYQIAMYI